MVSTDKYFEEKINKSEELTDLQKSNVDTFIYMVMQKLGIKPDISYSSLNIDFDNKARRNELEKKAKAIKLNKELVSAAEKGDYETVRRIGNQLIELGVIEVGKRESAKDKKAPNITIKSKNQPLTSPEVTKQKTMDDSYLEVLNKKKSKKIHSIETIKEEDLSPEGTEESIETVPEPIAPVKPFNIDKSWLLGEGIVFFNSLFNKKTVDNSLLSLLNNANNLLTNYYGVPISLNEELERVYTKPNLYYSLSYRSELLRNILALYLGYIYQVTIFGNFDYLNIPETGEYPINVTIPRVIRGNFFPDTLTLTQELNSNQYLYDYIEVLDEDISTAEGRFVTHLAGEQVTVDLTSIKESNWFRLEVLDSNNQPVEIQPQSFNYDAIVNRILSNAQQEVDLWFWEEDPFYSPGLDEDIVKEQLERIIKYTKEGSFWNDYEKQYKLGKYPINKDADNLYSFELNFNWCGFFIAYVFRHYLKRNILKKYLPSTSRMYEYYNVRNNFKTQNYNKNNIKKDNYKNEALINQRAYIIDFENVWILRRLHSDIDKLNGNPDLTFVERKAGITSFLEEAVEIYNTILKKGDVISLNPTRKYPFGEHFGILRDELFYEFYELNEGKVDAKIIAPMVEGNVFGNRVENTQREARFLQVRYRFQPEDFVIHINSESPTRKDTVKKAVYYKVRST